ncbi:MAG: histidine phosphatase family protein, partial [Candidatus Eremiobacteraeota bacterium]|nr:histidine phosphatase family protein [Candidatus Eremiobacteraeota bacterium]
SWVSVDRALRLLTYDHDRDLVRNFSKGLRAAGEHESTGANADGSLRTRTNGLIYLVRHAKAGNRSAWDAADEERPLSKSGRKQARALVERLAAFSIGRIISSPHVRCRETVEPLAQHRGLAVETSECLSEGSDSDDALELLSACAGKPTVLCSHGDIVGDVLTALAAEGMAADSQLRWEKGSIWALESDGRSFVYGRYLPPP